MIEIITSLLLHGNITNNYGRIGITVGRQGRIVKVYTHSSAHDIGLERGDIILSADGVKGTSKVTGIAGTYASIEIKHGDFIHTYIIPRITEREVYDYGSRHPKEEQ